MPSELDCYCAKIQVFDENDNLILEDFLKKIPLTEEIYEIKGEEILGNPYPCILERKLIEKNLCVEIINRVEKEKKYTYEELKWFFEWYGLNGEFISFIY